MAETTDSTTQRRAGILDAAIEVFARYGFKKTSMDDLARAAGLSRPGLYLHFPTKEALFKEGVLRVIEAIREAGRAALGCADVGIEERLLGAFVAIHGVGVGHAARQHMNELLEAAATLLGPVVAELEKAQVADLARVLTQSGVAASWKEAGLSARELAEHLVAASYGIKHRVPTAEEYRERMKVAVRLVCRGGSQPERRGSGGSGGR
jgi:AcrR family transcriptional regulator